jgi:hypothetical protein
VLTPKPTPLSGVPGRRAALYGSGGPLGGAVQRRRWLPVGARPVAQGDGTLGSEAGRQSSGGARTDEEAAAGAVAMMNEGVTTFGAEFSVRQDRRSHIQRICPTPHGESPAWLPRAAQWHAGATQLDAEPPQEPHMGERKRYFLRDDAFMDDAIVRAGSTVMLFDEEVGPHHRLIEDPDYDADVDPAPSPGGEGCPMRKSERGRRARRQRVRRRARTKDCTPVIFRTPS